MIILEAMGHLHFSVGEAIDAIADSPMSRIFVFDDWVSPHNFWKQFLSGAFIAIVMTGLDQDMMQKNLTCKTLKDAQKDMCTYGVAFVPANLLFLALGILLTMVLGTSMKGDELLPTFVQGTPTIHYSLFTLHLFVLGIVAASFSSADSALTSLTTSYCVDIRRQPDNELLRKRMHIVMCFIFVMSTPPHSSMPSISSHPIPTVRCLVSLPSDSLPESNPATVLFPISASPHR